PRAPQGGHTCRPDALRSREGHRPRDVRAAPASGGRDLPRRGERPDRLARWHINRDAPRPCPLRYRTLSSTRSGVVVVETTPQGGTHAARARGGAVLG